MHSNSDTSIESKKPIFLIHKVKKKTQWTPFEDKILYMIAKSNGCKNWKKIAEQQNNRTATQCYMRYSIIKSKYEKGRWTKEQDEELLNLVNKHGKHWSKISKFYIKNRTGKQIRDRYVNVLDPNLNKEAFSNSEDEKIVQMYILHGRKWAFISKMLYNRTSESVKNRFYSYLKKKIHLM